MTHTRPRFSFIATIALLNLSTGVMFFMISQPAPIAVAAHYSSPVISTKKIVNAKPAIVGQPTRIVIPSLAIDLPVDVGSYDVKSGTWTTSLTAAYYANASVPVNDNNGTTLIYGHAQAPIFIDLPQIKSNAVVKIYTTNGHVFQYRYNSKRLVTPTNTDVFKTSGAPTLVLQTCTGDWDAYRALFAFSLDSVKKA